MGRARHSDMPLFGYFGPRPPRARRDYTSQRAADRIALVAPAIRHRIYEFIKSKGAEGATADECAVALGLKPTQARPRCSELFEDGVITKSDRKRENADGNPMIVWVAR